MDELKTFLDKQASRQETGLIITRGETPHELASGFAASKYQSVTSLKELFAALETGSPAYWIYTGGNFQLLYSFIAQYSGGIIELHDTATGAQYVSQNPSPGFALVLSREQLGEIEQDGYDLLSRVGMTLQLEK